MTDPVDFRADGADYGPGQLCGLAAAVGAGETESVVVTITRWPSLEARALGNAAATRDPRVLSTLEGEPVFDGERLIAQSFETV